MIPFTIKSPKNQMSRQYMKPIKRLINTFNLEKLVIKIPKDPKTIAKVPSTPETTIPDSTLTTSETELITNSSFVQNLLPPHLSLSPEGGPLPDRVKAVAQYIPLQHGLLTYHRPKNSPTPFQIYKLPEAEVVPGHTPISEFPRLSVTMILTQQWCELRDFFEIYSRTPREETDAMRKGRKEHLKLELETHPEIDMSDVLEHIPQVELKEVDVYCQSVVDAILRLVTLLQTGRAREIYVHGFIDEFGVIDDGEVLDEDSMIVTGVIDHLVLKSSDRERPIEHAFKQMNDLKDIVDLGSEVISKHPSSYFLLVSDVKTRSQPTLPSQASVLQGAKSQVMIYRKFLEVLGGRFGAQWLEEYCKRKKIDIDEPITPEFALGLIYTHDVFWKDFERMRDGVDVGIEGFDNHKHVSNYDLSYLKSSITDPEMLEKISPFLKPWSRAPTTRYFISRLSKMFHNTALLLRHEELRVEYFFQGKNLHDVYFQYDENVMATVAAKGLEFWKGYRDPQPVEGTFKNINSICKYCDFKDHCLWTKEMEQQNYDRGHNSMLY